MNILPTGSLKGSSVAAFKGRQPEGFFLVVVLKLVLPNQKREFVGKRSQKYPLARSLIV